MARDLISVIIPVYNREKYIQECLESVLSQSYKALEILVIDDGSTDRTVDICKEMCNQDPRIRLIQGTHAGVSAARNMGLDAAAGEYVFFIDSDDIIHPCMLETLHDGMVQYGAAIAGSRCLNIPNEKWSAAYKRIQSQSGPGEIAFKPFSQALDAMFKGNSPLGLLGGTLFKRSLVGQTRFRTDLYIGEDFYFIYENMLKQADAVFLIPKWYYARMHDANSSWDFGYTGFMNRLYRRELVWESEERMGRPQYADMQKRQVFGNYLILSKHHAPGSEELKKMRRVLHTYRRKLLPAMSLRTKLAFTLAVYIPWLYTPLQRLVKGVEDKGFNG